MNIYIHRWRGKGHIKSFSFNCLSYCFLLRCCELPDQTFKLFFQCSADSEKKLIIFSELALSRQSKGEREFPISDVLAELFP